MDNRCTFWFNGNWVECCVWHDYACHDARVQRSAEMRKKADYDLFRCVSNKGHPAMALIMLTGVRAWAILNGGY